jgi:hypothetical protein
MKYAPLLLMLLSAVFAAPSRVHGADDKAASAASKERARECSRLLQQRFYRQASMVLDHLTRYAGIDESKLTLTDRFLRAFYEGRWDELRTTLEELSDEQAATIYDKMLDDMTGRTVPLLTLDDFLGLADACPDKLSTSRIRKLGQLLHVAVAKEQEIWLKQAIDKGTRRLGRAKDKKLATGRILAFAEFDELARQYLPNTIEAGQLDDAEVRDEIVKFLASHEELEEFQQKQIAALWQQKAAILANPAAEWAEKQQAADRLTELLGKTPTASIEPWIRTLLSADMEGGLRLATTLGKSAPSKGTDADVAMRSNNLKTQKCLLLCAGEHADLSQTPWSQVATAMADWWIREAEHCFQNHPGFQSNGAPKPHVVPEDLLESAPDGAWAKALPASLRERVDVCLSRAVLVSDRYEEAVDLIVKIAQRNRQAGAALAEDYVKAWAYRHDPQIPEEIRKKYKLAEDARIAVTPIMMEKNVASLAKMMEAFRKHGIPPRNAKLLADAFVVCYSSAEVYRRSHIEKVFGPVEAMDEEIFLQMIRTMTEGLASRWRKIDLQKESGTRRTQSETLEMVLEGYRSAIAMIDQRAAKQKDAWRILTLAGSLSSDWGDFEYYQELTAETKARRMEAFREKNGMADQYFRRAAEAYAVQLPKLGRGGYVIDVYLAWFHSLLGVDTDGDLNLSKPLDRRALNKIHELIRALPGDAPQIHFDKFARHVNARLEDRKQPLHEELKYRYLAGSLVITRDSPFSFQANSKVSYYDELLNEIRLETRVDGPSTIHRDQEFGILLSVQHTEAMGRMADFGKYLVNQAPVANPPWSKPQSQPGMIVRKMRDVKGRRDDLELNIREALALFFDIKSVTFSPRDVQARATERPGWKETVLAYILVKAKDSSVDKIPRVQMSFEFLDMAGPVSISAESPETMIKMTDQKAPPRPFQRVDLTEVLDSRNLASSEEVLLEITAMVSGLAPELDDLVDLDALGKQFPVARIDPHEGTLVREVQSWGDTIHAVSERRWTVALDASSLLKPPRRVELRLPVPKVAGGSAKYQAYKDMDLVDLREPVSIVGTGEGKVEAKALAASRAWLPYAVAGGAVGVTLLVGLAIAWLARRRGPRPLRARDVFHMPARVDGFVVIQLLRLLGSSSLVRLSGANRAAMQREIDRIQSACFGGNGSSLSDDELRNIARKWLQLTR